MDQVVPTDAAPDNPSAGCDAGAISCAGKCVDVESDPLNCGRCVHDCGTGSNCMAGACQPVLVTSDAAGAVALATDTSPDDPTTVAAHVFWAVSSGMGSGAFQVNANGGNKITLSTSGTFQTDVIVHGQSVYWPTWSVVTGFINVVRGTVGMAATQTGAGTTSFINNGANGIILNPAGNKLYGAYSNANGFGVYKCALDGTMCTMVTGFSGKAGINLATDGTTVFVADQMAGAIAGIGWTSGNVTNIKTGLATPNLLRVDNMQLYWSNAGSKTIWRSDLSGSSAKQIANTTNPATGLAVDSVNVYWTDSVLGTVSYTPIGGGGTVTTYVTQGMSMSPMRLVRDTQSLYWIQGSSIWRVALP